MEVPDKRERYDNTSADQRMSGFAGGRKDTDLLRFSPEALGQNCPTHCPSADGMLADTSPGALGDAITIREVAAIIGCSVWTVRQRCMRQGLPHFRPSRTGKLIF